jgi:hypothetical protein
VAEDLTSITWNITPTASLWSDGTALHGSADVKFTWRILHASRRRLRAG